MTRHAKHHVGDVLYTLAEHLDRIIQAQLDVTLERLEWTRILTELDRLKGATVRVYSRKDIQAQLRVLTEKLGGLGFPFDDHHRTVSTLGGELRIVRNSFAHGDDFTWLDAFRAADFGARLLDHLGDEAGKLRLVALRDEALPLMANERGIAIDVAALDAEIPTAEFTGHDVGSGGDAPSPTRMNASVVEEESGAQTVPKFAEFSPWPVVIAGPSEVIDELPKKVAKMQVRAVAAEIVEYEGPIHIDRLARLTIQAFGWKRLRQPRLAQLARQIKQVEGVVVDDFGFVWPADMVAGEWSGFRVGCDGRELHEVSPHELANAVTHVRAAQPGITDDELRREVLALFGRTRLTAGAVRQLEQAIVLAR